MAAIKRKIRPLARNPNKHTQRGLRELERSIREDGWVAPVTVAADGESLDGAARLEVAADVMDGIEPLVIEHDGKRPVVMVRTDIPNADTPEARRIAYRANRVAELDLEWDAEVLAADVAAGFDVDGLWDADELADLGIKTDPPDAPEPQVDKADELRQKWGTALGQLWEIGEHRLICGDCTDRAVVERCLDVQPGIMVTDPPYGVSYDPMFRQEALGAAVRRAGRVVNDSRSDWREAWALFNGDVAYCWSGMRTALELLSSFHVYRFEVHAEIIWAKPHFPFGRGHYLARHESCWYFVRAGASAHWAGNDAENTLWPIALDKTADGGHGTQKPVECMERPIRNHDDMIVYDPFVGSGTTIVACERLGRKCRAIEIDPGYVAVCLQRLADMGLEPRLVES